MHIEIMIEDLSTIRVPVEKAHLLPKTGVLTIILSCRDDERPRRILDGIGYRRLTEVTGKDFYYLLDLGGGRYSLDSRDEFELIESFDKEDPWNENKFRREHPKFIWPTIIFEGKAIPDKEWKEALEIFNKEMH